MYFLNLSIFILFFCRYFLRKTYLSGPTHLICTYIYQIKYLITSDCILLLYIYSLIVISLSCVIFSCLFIIFQLENGNLLDYCSKKFHNFSFWTRNPYKSFKVFGKLFRHSFKTLMSITSNGMLPTGTIFRLSSLSKLDIKL